MNKRVLVLVFASFLASTFNVFAASDEEAEAQCRQYASEEGVPAHELDEYLSQCVQELLAESKSSND